MSLSNRGIIHCLLFIVYCASAPSVPPTLRSNTKKRAKLLVFQCRCSAPLPCPTRFSTDKPKLSMKDRKEISKTPSNPPRGKVWVGYVSNYLFENLKIAGCKNAMHFVPTPTVGTRRATSRKLGIRSEELGIKVRRLVRLGSQNG